MSDENGGFITCNIMQILKGSDDGVTLGIIGFLDFVHRPVF
jgi:hypothetical protein